MLANRSYFKVNVDDDQIICLKTKHEQMNNAEVSNQYQNQSLVMCTLQINDYEMNI